jgi:hypothetical protein
MGATPKDKGLMKSAQGWVPVPDDVKTLERQT